MLTCITPFLPTCLSDPLPPPPILFPFTHQSELTLDAALRSFASEGLRTLVVTKRDVSKSLADTWLPQYIAAQNNVGDREARLADVASAIEVELVSLGATAIEDRLQVRPRLQPVACCVWFVGHTVVAWLSKGTLMDWQLLRICWMWWSTGWSARRD